jgi:hypothetical protein
MKYYYDRHELEELLVKAQNNYDSKIKKIKDWEAKHQKILEKLFWYNNAANRFHITGQQADELSYFDELSKCTLVAPAVGYSVTYPEFVTKEPKPQPQHPMAPPNITMTGREAQIALSQVEQEILVKALK